MAGKYEDREMPFLEHLEEFRWRLIKSVVALTIGTIIALFFAKDLLQLLLWPTTRLDHPLNIQVLKVQGMFIVTLQVGVFGGLLLSLPYILYQIWAFVAPGLLPRERRYIPRLIGSALVLFLVGTAFAYFVVLPFALDFFIGLAPEEIQANIAIDFYIGFALRLLILFGIIFELPVLVYFLSKMGIVTPELMKKYRRHAIVAIFVVAAILTPPDVVTQVMLGIPLILLYELSIYISALVRRKKEEAEAEEEAEEKVEESEEET